MEQASTPSSTSIDDMLLKADSLLKSDIESAIVEFRKIVSLDPSRRHAWSQLATCLMLKHRFEEAVDAADGCIKADPDWAKAHSRKASALHALRRYDDARRVFQVAIRLSTDKSEKSSIQGLLAKSSSAAVSLKLVEAYGAGKFMGKVSEEMGDYEQIYDFHSDGTMKISLFGAVRPATYKLDIDRNPYLMWVSMLDEGRERMADIPYCFRFNRDEEGPMMEMVCPFGENIIPREFDGPGYVVMRPFSGDFKDTEEAKAHAEVSKFDEKTKVLKFMEELCVIADSTKVEDPSKHLTLQVKMSKLERKYGDSTLNSVMVLVNGCELSKDAQLWEKANVLRVKMFKKGLLTKEIMEEARFDYLQQATAQSGVKVMKLKEKLMKRAALEVDKLLNGLEEETTPTLPKKEVSKGKEDEEPKLEPSSTSTAMSSLLGNLPLTPATHIAMGQDGDQKEEGRAAPSALSLFGEKKWMVGVSLGLVGVLGVMAWRRRM